MKRLLYFVPTAVLAVALPFSIQGSMGIIVCLGGLIFFHELGHFLAAKRMRIPVEVFSIGFGPRLCGFKWKETDVRLALLPLGGYVKLSGYNPEDPDAADPHGFLKQPYGKRMLFYSGGVLANMLMAFLLLWGYYTDEARVVSWDTQSIQSSAPLPGGRADKGGLKAGDEIIQVGDLKYPDATWEQTVAYIQSKPEIPVPFKIRRKGTEMTLDLVPENVGGKGKLGLPPFERLEVPKDMRSVTLADISTGFTNGMKGTVFGTINICYGFWRLVSFQADYREVGGPATIGAMAYREAKAGWRHLVAFMAFLSINLAVLNALPIPFLDGGHMMILTFEKLRRRDLTIQLKEKIITGGFFFLVTLMALVFALDLWRFRQ